MNAVAMPLTFVLLWSTGFIGARLGLPYAEPWTFLALRFGVVAACLATLMVALAAPWPTAVQWRQQGCIGLFNHVAYLGGVFVSIEWGLEAGLSAVIIGVQPIAIALGARLFLAERLSTFQWFGMALGLGGVVLIVVRKFGAGIGDPWSLGASFVALLGISFGSLLQKRYSGTLSLLPGNMVQFTVAALVCTTFALAFETRRIEWTVEFSIALVWSIVVLSFGALSLYYVLIRRGAASRVASLFFLVPPSTAAIAWALFGERLGPLSLAGMTAAALGVLIVLRAPRRSPASSGGPGSGAP